MSSSDESESTMLSRLNYTLEELMRDINTIGLPERWCFQYFPQICVLFYTCNNDVTVTVIIEGVEVLQCDKPAYIIIEANVIKFGNQQCLDLDHVKNFDDFKFELHGIQTVQICKGYTYNKKKNISSCGLTSSWRRHPRCDQIFFPQEVCSLPSIRCSFCRKMKTNVILKPNRVVEDKMFFEKMKEHIKNLKIMFHTFQAEISDLRSDIDVMIDFINFMVQI